MQDRVADAGGDHRAARSSSTYPRPRPIHRRVSGPGWRIYPVYPRLVDGMPQPSNESSLRTFSDGNLRIDFVERLVIYDVCPASLRNRVELTPGETVVLAVLIEHRHERPLWGPQLSELAWGSTDDEAAKRTLDVIARLQFKLGQTDLPRCPVELAPGVGCWYRMLHP